MNEPLLADLIGRVEPAWSRLVDLAVTTNVVLFTRSGGERPFRRVGLLTARMGKVEVGEAAPTGATLSAVPANPVEAIGMLNALLADVAGARIRLRLRELRWLEGPTCRGLFEGPNGQPYLTSFSIDAGTGEGVDGITLVHSWPSIATVYAVDDVSEHRALLQVVSHFCEVAQRTSTGSLEQ